MKPNIITNIRHDLKGVYSGRHEEKELEIGDTFIPNKQSGYKCTIKDKKDGYYILSDGNNQHVYRIK